MSMTMNSIFSTDLSNPKVYQNISTALYNDLMTGYSKSIIPNITLEGKYRIVLKEIVKIDEKRETLITSSNIYVGWFDSRLSWNTSIYPLKSILIPG